MLPDVFVSTHVDLFELAIVSCSKVLTHLDGDVFGQDRQKQLLLFLFLDRRHTTTRVSETDINFIVRAIECDLGFTCSLAWLSMVSRISNDWRVSRKALLNRMSATR